MTKQKNASKADKNALSIIGFCDGIAEMIINRFTPNCKENIILYNILIAIKENCGKAYIVWKRPLSAKDVKDIQRKVLIFKKNAFKNQKALGSVYISFCLALLDDLLDKLKNEDKTAVVKEIHKYMLKVFEHLEIGIIEENCIDRFEIADNAVKVWYSIK